MSNGLFDNMEEEDDQLFKDLEAKPNNRETTPEFFSEVKPSDDMNLFSPSKPKNTLFDFEDEDNDTTKESRQEDNDLNDDEAEPINDNISEEPLGFLKDEENNEDDQEDREEFELIDSTEVPSVEEAERHLEIARQESERIKREQEEEQRREEEGEESQDGAGFSRVFGGSAAPDSPTSIEVPTIHGSDEVEEKDVSNENNDKVVEELQQEVSQLTTSLRSAQAENGSLNSEVSELRIQLTEEKDENDKLREELKKKDAEIASLKETIATGGGKPPKPTTRKPSIPSTTKQPAVSSPRTTSARLKQDTDKKSVAETAKRFNQSDSKKTSPSLRRSTKKDSVDKPDSRIPRQDSATRKTTADSPSASDKKSSSPPKPVRSKARPDSKSEASPMISHKPHRNTLDAIKLWEQKTGDKKEETSPAVVKKPLSTVTSAPHVGDDTTNENGEENLPPSSDGVVDTEEEAVTEEQKSPLRKDTSNAAFARQRKTESMIVPGTKSKRWAAPTVDKCQVCKKTVYPMERLLADEKMYHKTCFRCSHCKKVVGLGTYAANKGEIFCKTHFKMLFKIKGNYDEGFGRTQHKSKWTKGQGGAPDQETTAAD